MSRVSRTIVAIAGGVLLVGTAVFLTACWSGGDAESVPRAAAPVGRESVAGVSLYPLPRPVATRCRRIGTRAQRPLLCPTRLPRPSRSLASSAFIPYPLSAGPLGATGKAVTGLNFSYSAETGRPTLDGPARFLHFDVQVREADDPLPPKTHPATLGGRLGLLAPATSRNYAAEPYFANHVRFLWREHGTRYAATLHNFGANTKPVLGAIVRSLRPAREIAAAATSTPGVDVLPVPIAGPSAVAVDSAGAWVAGTGALGTRRGERTALVRLDPASGDVVFGPRLISRYTGPTALTTSGGPWLGQFGFHQPDILHLGKDGEGFTRYFTAGMNVGDLAVTRETIWALDFGEFRGLSRTAVGTIERVERRSGRTAARIGVGRAPAQLALGFGRVWVTNNQDESLSRVDSRTNRVTATTPVGAAPVGVAAGWQAIWVANSASNTVSRVDPESARVTQTVDVGRGPRGVAVGNGSVWVTNYLDDTVSRIDPASGRVIETIRVGAGPTGIAVGDGAVWVADLLDQTVSRVEP